MNEEKTRLQIVKEQLNKKMTRAIVEAIENGAQYQILSQGALRIDGIYLTPKLGTEYHGLILDIDAPEIEQLLKPTEDELKRRAEELRAELNEINEQLNGLQQ